MNTYELENMEKHMRKMEDRPHIGRPKKMRVELGMSINDCICDEHGGLFNTGDEDLAVLLCWLYNNAEDLIDAAKRDAARKGVGDGE